MTSQSIQMVRSPSAVMSVTARRLRPMRRWISCVRPPTLPRAASRSERVWVERGNMPYSAVTQPAPAVAQERRHALLHRRRAQHARRAERDQRRALGVPQVVRSDLHRSQLPCASSIWTRASRPSQSPSCNLLPFAVRAFACVSQIAAWGLESSHSRRDVNFPTRRATRVGHHARAMTCVRSHRRTFRGRKLTLAADAIDLFYATS